jgi:hypothetical protein
VDHTLNAPPRRAAQVGAASGAARRLIPLWRHLAWALALAGTIAVWAQVRVDVRALRDDLGRSARAHREARLRNEHLRLELDARRRAVAMEQAATALGLGEPEAVVVVAGDPDGGQP